MAELSDQVPLDQALAAYRDLLDRVEPTFPRYRARAESLPANDPEAILTRGWLGFWEEVRSAVDQGADIDYGELFEAIRELGNSLPELRTTRPPFDEGLTRTVRDSFCSQGFTDEQGDLIVDQASKPEMGAPRRDPSEKFEAYRLDMAGDSYPQIANKLCPEHGNSPKHRRLGRAWDSELDRCSEKYRGQIRELKRLLQKYTAKPSR